MAKTPSTYLDCIDQSYAFAMLPKVFRLDVLKNLHASRSLQTRVECVRRKRLGAEAADLVLKLLVVVNSVRDWVVHALCTIHWIKGK